jgi:hypothetical protein
MIADARYRFDQHCYYADHDGSKVGVVEATKSPPAT